MPDKQIKLPDLIDLLPTTPSSIPFEKRVKSLNLSAYLENKVLKQEGLLPEITQTVRKNDTQLTVADEREMATEVLLLRHRFTELVLHSRIFRQAALTIVQNIYLFQNRKIFFGTSSIASSEEERQEALILFSSNPSNTTIPLAKTFQHLVLARIWNRILNNAKVTDLQTQHFLELHAIVEKLNTIRNIYMILTTRMIKTLVAKINDIYKESVTFEDAVQIGSFGVARAAYRYHQSSGVRFSTFAANWVFKEIQRQSLSGRLIRLSSNTVEQYTRALKTEDTEKLYKYTTRIQNATTAGEETFNSNPSELYFEFSQDSSSPARKVESSELKTSLLDAIDQLLSEKSGDIIRRRYGLPPYQDKEQSVISISEVYGVTRGSIYQLEQSALKTLYSHLHSMPG